MTGRASAPEFSKEVEDAIGDVIRRYVELGFSPRALRILARDAVDAATLPFIYDEMDSENPPPLGKDDGVR